MDQMVLHERDKRILITIVDAYVSDGNPVSSRRVRDAGGYRVSTATIRNAMGGLEKRGYLVKTHTSSGRVPTDEGYRAYVDDVLANRTSSFADYSSECRSRLRHHVEDVGALMMHASRLLAHLSRNFAVVYGEVEMESRVRALKLVQLEGPRLLVIVNFEPAHERTTVLRIDRDFPAEAVAVAETQLNGTIAGLSLDGANEALRRAMRDNVTDEGIIASQVAINRDAIFFEPPAVELFVEERSDLLGQPELADPKNLQSILRILHNKRYLTSVLAARSQEGTEVTIGTENRDDTMRPFSLVTSGYRMGAARGVLGIIGPTRMRYDVALSLVSAVSRELRAIGEEYF